MTDVDLQAVIDVERLADERFRALGMDELLEGASTNPDAFRKSIRDSIAWVTQHEGGEVVAFLLASGLTSSLHIDQVSVSPAYSRLRIGKKMLDVAADEAIRRGYSWMTLTTFSAVPWNRPYYESLGFRRVPHDQISADLVAIQAHESAMGLDHWPRICLRLRLD